jgi:dipeptidase E
MRTLLTSGGIRPGPVQDAVEDLLGKPLAEARVAFVIDAILPFAGDNSMLLRHLNEHHGLGWAEFDVVSLFGGPRSVIESRLRSADVVLGYGGSNHWLAHAWHASGLVPALERVLEEQVYVGLSAGSMIFSRHHAAFVEAFHDEEEVAMLELETVEAALPLLDWFPVCHLGASWYPDDVVERVGRSTARLGAPVWFLDDDTALRVRDPEAEPEVVGDGHWLRYDATGRIVEQR